MEDVQLDNLIIEEPQPLVIKIDLGDGKLANIAAYKNSNPFELARRFCDEYHLPESVIEPLRARI